MPRPRPQAGPPTPSAPLIAMVLAAALAACTAGEPGGEPDPLRGKAVAEEWCAACHQVSPEQLGDTLEGAPSFMEIAEDPDRDAAGLVAFMHQQKLPMTTFRLTDPERADVAAYIMALQREQASDAAEPTAGRALAAAYCARCHAIEPGGASPLAEAPPFDRLVGRWPPEYLAEALAEGIVVGHEGAEMPEFTLEPAQIDDLIAFLRSLPPR